MPEADGETADQGRVSRRFPRATAPESFAVHFNVAGAPSRPAEAGKLNVRAAETPGARLPSAAGNVVIVMVDARAETKLAAVTVVPAAGAPPVLVTSTLMR